MSCKVGNQTNSQDPQAVNSRVFVGNLNTFQCSKTDVERIFQRYGRIAGISMHKGYAFIQFTNPFDARSACLGEDGRLLWGQTLDVNMVAEPKAHQTGRKRQNIAKTGNDWDYYYDSLKLQLESIYHSYYAQVGFPGPRLVPPMKRARLHVPQNSQNSKSATKLPSPTKSHPNSTCNSLGDLKSYSTPDILICGNCRELFSEVEQLLEHKKTYCKLRFTCKCHTINGKTSGEEPAALLCSQCKDSFQSAWDLMVHVQAAHMLNIYQLCVDQPSAKDQMEGKEGENGSCFTSSNGSVDRSSPTNGFNPNGALALMGDSLMEDSHCQTDLDLSPNHRLENSSLTMDISGSNFLGGCSSTVTGNSISASTSTNDCGSSGHSLSLNPQAMTDLISLRNCQGSLVSNTNGEIYNGVNQVHLVNGGSFGGSTLSSSSSTCSIVNIGMGQVNNNNNNNNNFSGSPTLYSQPMEASTQTSQSDNNLLLTAVSGPSVNSSGNSSGGFDEHCGLVSAIKSEVASVHLPLTNGQVAGV